ncbi:type II toxin-antitoxin system ParD family antitoxin [Jiella sonneratiae]|uniref:Type II toxin-antitoxin system ParD family antitoxin n=1 Tax=Jiella sonneratiae TaxID=2816856 RepID=A0ABS3J6D2_9HYPH|nr:type II toxin-antitoxin system ParD family antitoxin [Jiella sonneratiae]MBO0904657.1 type II toxin-antitoxin system ParD family antitoxin [Jiella sonneratiae]
MSSVKTLDLGEHFRSFVDGQVEAGNFASADAVVRAGLSLLERQSADEEARIRAAIEAGEASGDYRELDWDALYERIEAEEAAAVSPRAR